MSDQPCAYVLVCPSLECAGALELAASAPAADGVRFGGLGEQRSDGSRYAYILWGIDTPARVRIWAQLDGAHPDAQLFCVRDTPDWARLSGWEGDDLTPWALPG